MRVVASLKLALCIVVLLGWAAGTALLAWIVIVYPHEVPAAPSRDVPLEVPLTSTPEATATALARAEAVRHPRAFAFLLRLHGADRALRGGWVVGNRALSPYQHLARVARGFGSSQVDVLIPEGFTSFDVATRLERFTVAPRDRLLAATRDPALLLELAIPATSAEGYLFPALYRFHVDSPPERVVERMVGIFRIRTAALLSDLARAQLASPTSALTPHQLVTLASIIEREARVPEERPTIAGVFANRLFAPGFTPRRLQADPTVAYGCLVHGARIPSCASFDGRRITPAMVRDPENPYSTYRHEGLPPGPICNPGLSALAAAVAPERHAYFYFVAKGGGRHAFAHSLSEHNRNIRGAAPSGEAVQ